MKRSVQWADVVFSAAMLAVPFATKAEVSVDLTQGVPGYWSADGHWISGSVPDGYQQSATSNTLIITALPNLTETQSSPSNVNNSVQIGLTGDFSATVTASVAYSGLLHSGSGGFGINNGSNGLWAEINTTQTYVDSWYGLPGAARVGTQQIPHDGASVQLNLARSGQNLSLSYAFGNGAFSTAQTLTGQNVLGNVGFYLFGWGPPNDPAATQITFSDFTYTAAPATISGMTGGTASNPTDLSAATVGALYGTIGEPGHVADFFTFYWGGGYFSANVGVPGAENLTYVPDDLLFKLCNGGNCVSQDSYLASALAEEANQWDSLLEALLDPGFYTIGVVDTAFVTTDPPFYVTFATPTTATNEHPPGAVPEPTTLLLLATGLSALAYLKRRHI